MERRESPETDLHKCSHVIFDKGTKAIQRRKESLFDKWSGTTRQPRARKMNLGTDLTPFTNINLKWILDLNIKHKTIKLADNTGEKLDDLEFGDDF